MQNEKIRVPARIKPGDTIGLFILQQYYKWLMVLAALTLCISAFFAIRAIRLHQQNSPFNESFKADSSDISTPTNHGRLKY